MGLWEAEAKLRKKALELSEKRSRIDQIWKLFQKKITEVETRRVEEEKKLFKTKKIPFQSGGEAAEFRKAQRKKHKDLISEFEELLK